MTGESQPDSSKWRLCLAKYPRDGTSEVIGRDDSLPFATDRDGDAFETGRPVDLAERNERKPVEFAGRELFAVSVIRDE